MNQNQKERRIIRALAVAGLVVCAGGYFLDQLILGLLLTQLCWVMAFSRGIRLDDDTPSSDWQAVSDSHQKIA